MGLQVGISAHVKNSCVRETDTNDLNFCRIFICEGHRKPGGDHRDENGGIDGVLPWFLNRTQCRLGSAEDGGRAQAAFLCLSHSCFILPIPCIVLLVKNFFFFCLYHAANGILVP